MTILSTVILVYVVVALSYILVVTRFVGELIYEDLIASAFWPLVVLVLAIFIFTAFICAILDALGDTMQKRQNNE